MTPGGPAALGQSASGVLAGFLILGSAVWVGGLVAIFVVPARCPAGNLRPALIS